MAERWCAVTIARISQDAAEAIARRAAYQIDDSPRPGQVVRYLGPGQVGERALCRRQKQIYQPLQLVRYPGRGDDAGVL